MEERRNYYRLLHLQPDAPSELVRANFRVLMQKMGAHPDLGGEHATAAELSAAYSTLKDPVRRAEYDEELLERYDIATLSRGTRNAAPRRPGPAGRTRVNRRNYYRVLQVQRDAPPEVIEASYRTLRVCQVQGRKLLDEAFALVSDEANRRAYDALIADHEHPEVIARLGRQAAKEVLPSYRPRISHYCAFCKAPSAEPASDSHRTCADCNSPMDAPPADLLALARREVSRLERDERVSLYLGWPGPTADGRVQDLSPTGMRCTTAAPLDPGDVLKIDSRAFDAVGAVAYRRREGQSTNAGFRFLTVRFPDARGTFISTRA